MSEQAAEASAEAAEATAEAGGSQPEADNLGDAGKKALDAERSRAKEAERRARAAEKALESERAKGLSEAERAIADAKAAGRQEATVEAGKRLARAEIKAAAASAGINATDLIDDLDLTRFVGEDGEPDEKAIADRVKRWAAMAPTNRPRGDVDQGHRGKAGPASPRDEFASFLQGQITST